MASRHGSFPILLETYRECLSDVFDLPALVSLMADVRRPGCDWQRQARRDTLPIRATESLRS